MSVEAITWAFAQHVDRSSSKFVLVAMANLADADMVCWPSIAYLVGATRQDRKTVIENMKRLRDAGFIEPTDARKGGTSQVIVYRLKSPKNGTGKESQKRDIPKTVQVRRGGTVTTAVDGAADIHYNCGRHYLYRIEAESGQFYVGVRTCVGRPEDDPYMGSGRWVKACESAKVTLRKTILSEHSSRAEAEAQELILIDRSLLDPLCMNGPKTGTAYAKQTVPKTDGKSPVFPIEESRFSVETVPKTGHGTVNEPSREPSGNPKKPRAARSPSPACPEDVDGQTWDDWLALRTKKRAPVTATVIAEARREADKAGVTLSRFLAIWCAKGYQGMQADWIKPHERAGPPSAERGVRRGVPLSDAERDAANAAANAEAKRLLFGGKAQEVIDA